MSDPRTRPYRLGSNKVPVYYAGGGRIDRFRGAVGAPGPEDWVGSVTAFPPALLPEGADPETGVSRLEDGTSLRDLVASDPEGWLGRALAHRYGGEPGLLVKLLDADERLPVHCHPTREVARRKLGSPFGKTEGWIITEAEPEAEIWLGFRRDVEIDELQGWIDRQDAAAMLASMNRTGVSPGDVFYVPAGTVHAIGPGIMLTELQEPTSFSILAEYADFGLSAEQATLGLGWDAVLECFDRSSCRVADLRPVPRTISSEAGGRVRSLFPREADEFFVAHRVELAGSLVLPESSFRVAIVEEGEVVVTWRRESAPLRRGETWVLPYAAGELGVDGEGALHLCLPSVSSDT